MKIYLLAVSLFLAGCVSQQESLYNELGGKETIEVIAANFITVLDEDRAVSRYFEYTDMDRFYEQFVLHLCETSDGPCEYTGDDMVQTHIGLQITERDFNRTVDLLILAMDQAGVAHTTQNKLIKRLAPMRSEIIYR